MPICSPALANELGDRGFQASRPAQRSPSERASRPAVRGAVLREVRAAVLRRHRHAPPPIRVPWTPLDPLPFLKSFFPLDLLLEERRAVRRALCLVSCATRRPKRLGGAFHGQSFRFANCSEDVGFRRPSTLLYIT